MRRLPCRPLLFGFLLLASWHPCSSAAQGKVEPPNSSGSGYLTPEQEKKLSEYRRLKLEFVQFCEQGKRLEAIASEKLRTGADVVALYNGIFSDVSIDQRSPRRETSM